jgi:hypothetical protein
MGRSLSISSGRARRFQLVLIKPSHYDDDGYVIQWMRSTIPSNTLAALYALAADAADRNVLGSDVGFDIVAFDETNTRIRIKEIVSQFARHGGFGMVGLVGVQSNQFPRAVDIARPLRQAGIPVVIGGFHVSGCIAMLPELPADLKAALDLGCSLFAGEAEDRRMDQVLCDAAGARFSRSTTIWTICRRWRGHQRRFYPRPTCNERSITMQVLMQAAAVRSNARSAPSSMCRAASHAGARRTI